MAVERHFETTDQLTFKPSPRWIRATLDGATVIDSRRALLVWEPGKVVPAYAFPRSDIRAEALEGAGERRVALRADGRTLSEAAWTYDDPDLEGYLGIAWGALDHWYEEDEEVFIHPRDPFHRVDAMPSSRHVRVERDGQLIAESERPVLLFETGLPTRYYLPREDVDSSLLRDSETHTGCPYKGEASYHDVVIGEHRHRDLLWYYPDPYPVIAVIAGLLAPYNERVELIVDGDRQERPRTQWSSER
jgi:uncharacterized protein (DUF427 family)